MCKMDIFYKFEKLKLYMYNIGEISYEVLLCGFSRTERVFRNAGPTFHHGNNLLKPRSECPTQHVLQVAAVATAPNCLCDTGVSHQEHVSP